MKKTKRTEAQLKHIDFVKKHLKKGDLITHTRCMGSIEEHVFTGCDGYWLCGKPTPMTKKYGNNKPTNDISAVNITHINRELVEMIDFHKNL